MTGTRPPFVAIPDPDDPGAAEHTEEACEQKMVEWKPVGVLGALAGLDDADRQP